MRENDVTPSNIMEMKIDVTKKIKQLGTTADRHTVSRLTYYMSINIHTMYVDRDTVCQSTYSMSIGIHALMYLDRHTVCQLTNSMSIDILYVDRHIICQSRYCMSIGSCSQLSKGRPNGAK